MKIQDTREYQKVSGLSP